MDLILGHISPEPMSCPKLKNISLTLWVIRKTSFWFSGHVDPNGVVHHVQGEHYQRKFLRD